MDTDIETYRRHVEEAADFVADAADLHPQVGIILGTGLGQLTENLDVEQTLPYEDIPHFPSSTVESHEGEFLIGRVRERAVFAMSGRLHLYEGYSPREVTFPIRVMGTLGIEQLLISNAAGGMNPHFSQGDLVVVTDHINLQGSSPLVGPNVDDWGPRFPDMSEPYDVELREAAQRAALEHGIKLHEGVYTGVLGPNLETKAEYRFLRKIGGDLVGMSTVPEVIAARHMDIRVLALSVVTDECFPDALEPLTLEQALQAAKTADPKMTRIFEEVIARVGRSVEPS